MKVGDTELDLNAFEDEGSENKAGKGRGKNKGKGKMDRKEQTKLKRQVGQSGADHLGTRWKSEQEMHLRDNFD